jgi:transcriptional regulator with XRE-family HTH domain
LFGAQLRVLRMRRGFSQAQLGRLVHVSGALVSRIELSQRSVQPDLAFHLDEVLQADGALSRIMEPSREEASKVAPLPAGGDTASALRSVMDQIRRDDHAMGSAYGLETVQGNIRLAEEHLKHAPDRSRAELLGAVGEAYQLAGWMAFDRADQLKTEKLMGAARSRAEQAGDPALVAYVLGPNLSFAATYGGNPALGVERAYAGLGWARRSGNRKLVAFTMAMAARAHARLGEEMLCMELLDQALEELDRHDAATPQPSWLTVFDRSALEGHRGSCLLDLGLPEHAVEPLANQDSLTTKNFVRNRVIWRLDRAEAFLRLGEVEIACGEIDAAIDLAPRAFLPPRVVNRFHVAVLRLQSSATGVVAQDTAARLARLITVQRGKRV